ncbi:conserved hypothetical protein [Lodderomyces elongisporus NRRL YB-4239]|uniref:PSP1 C-terminal domain-containing protein n=1 Tax=Lodderomyces elongisporus (strain ATCC 11503 / CBS 2605 / JCM 1781 / NBRC 1676 / NRRL YB-4239) TaxID=379508 RepID=A5DU72_LODEL|nr:conserved hypothetical protein [Lodderomyces elongisporus NRRL YB-4239]
MNLPDFLNNNDNISLPKATNSRPYLNHFAFDQNYQNGQNGQHGQNGQNGQNGIIGDSQTNNNNNNNNGNGANNGNSNSNNRNSVTSNGFGSSEIAASGQGLGPSAPDSPLSQSNFNDILFSKLSDLNGDSPLNLSGYYHYNTNSTAAGNTFNLPKELQGGVSTISSRRPSYAAESFTRNSFLEGNSVQQNHYQSNNHPETQLGAFSANHFNNGGRDLSAFAMMNSYQQSRNNNFNDNFDRNNFNNNNFNNDSGFSLQYSFADLNLGTTSKFSEFQSRRPSQLVDLPYGSPFNLPVNLTQQQQPTQIVGSNNNNVNNINNNNNIDNNNDNNNNNNNNNQNNQNNNKNQNKNKNKNNNINANNTFVPFQENFSTQASSYASHQPVQHVINTPFLSNHRHQQQQQQQQKQKQQHGRQRLQPQYSSKHPFFGGNELSQLGQQVQSPHSSQPMQLENGLLLKDQYIVASQELKELFSKSTKYFQDPKLSSQVCKKIQALLTNPIVVKLITFIKNLNNLTFNHKILCLVINKNGKFDLLSYPTNSNIFLQKDDLVIVDGDRGKDMVMIVEPLVNLNFAILFNFLKKLEHLKSLTINDTASSKVHGGTHSTAVNASTIINSHLNEDNEFIITLPTKQVLRFATPKEVHKISGKFLEEKKAFTTCYNKIKELHLESDLTLINVEYQCDFKKLIFYYFANFKRIDFRGLIKELFKIYKTRIWLCAVLPFDRPELYITLDAKDAGHLAIIDASANENNVYNELNTNNKFKDENNADAAKDTGLLPLEYELSNEQILNFSITEFDHLPRPNYFHLINVLNLIQHLSNELNGPFYGFNTKSNK